MVGAWIVAAVLTVGLTVLLLASCAKWITSISSLKGREIVVNLSGASVLAAGLCISLSALMNIRIRRRGIARVTPGGSPTSARVEIQSAISVTRVFPMAVAVFASLAGALGVAASIGNWTVKGGYVLFWATWTAVGVYSIRKIAKTSNPELFFTLNDISVGSRRVRWDDIADVRPALRGAYPVIEAVWHRAVGGGGYGSKEGVLTIHPVRYHLDSYTMLSAIRLLSQSAETRERAINSPDYATLLFSRDTTPPVSV